MGNRQWAIGNREWGMDNKKETAVDQKGACLLHIQYCQFRLRLATKSRIDPQVAYRKSTLLPTDRPDGSRVFRKPGIALALRNRYNLPG